MLKRKSVAISACLVALAGCSSTSDSASDLGVSDIAAETSQGADAGLPEDSAADADVAFPELQGSWARACRLLDDADPAAGYEITVFTLSGDTQSAETTIYSDSECTSILERGFVQSGSSGQFNGFVERPDGFADTSVGEVPLIDITVNETLIDNEPLDAAVAGFFPEETTFDIVYVDDDTIYFGLETAALDKSTAQTRAQEIDFDVPYIRQ